MKLEEAITTALRYENQLRDIYLQGALDSIDPTGKKVFQDLADDEQSHVDYLEHALQKWKETGRIAAEELKSTVPPLEVIRKEAAKVSSHMSEEDRGVQQQQLSKALKVEKETSRFYQQLVAELPEEAQAMFSRFLEIENAHIEAVQFELDYVSHNGTWFGFEEFDLEVE